MVSLTEMIIIITEIVIIKRETFIIITQIVPYPGKGVCADPRSGDATFGVGGHGPPTTDNEHQLSLDRGEEKTYKMSENKEDDPTTASRGDYAQSECHCALYSNSVTYPLRGIASHCIIVSGK
jgi:hypothetical protein